MRAADLAACTAAVSTLQAALCARCNGLRAELLRRPGEDANGLVTLMEVYQMPAAADAAALEAQAAAASAPWLQGARHVEVFEPVSTGS